MKAEIIAIGSELLLGVTVDTNSAYLARLLAAMGLELSSHCTVGDNLERIVAAIDDALNRADIVLCTGGLGPTLDDLTRDAVARALGRPLEFRQELLDQVAARFAALRRPMSESNRVQAYVPQGARALENPRGTAPAFLIEDERGTVIALPGVPHEMRGLFENTVVPYLRDERGICGVTLVRTLHVSGLGESVLGERIADLMSNDMPAVGTSAKQGRIEIRISARAECTEAAEALVAPVEAAIRARLGTYLVGSETPIQQVARLLNERGLSLAIWEGQPKAPLYQMVQQDEAMRAQVRGVLIGTLSEAQHAALYNQPSLNVDSPTDQSSLDMTRAAARALRTLWQCDLGIGVQVTTDTAGDSFVEIHIVLATADDTHAVTRQYDLGFSEAWEYVGNLAIEVLRQYLISGPGNEQTTNTHR